MTWILHLAAGLYALNLAVGLVAQLKGVKFGVIHHGLYAVVFAGAIAAAVFEFRPALVLSLAALAGMPKARPHTWTHPTLAALGGLGYVGAYLLPSL